jgi:hypothetical protein
MFRKIQFLFLLLVLLVNTVVAQKTPSSFLNNNLISKVTPVEIDNPLSSENKKPDNVELFNYTFAVSITDLNLIKNGKWVINNDDEWVWILRINAKDAKAIALDFEKVNLNIGDELYIFNENKNIHNISEISLKYSDNYSSKFFDGDNISVEFNPEINDTIKQISKSITLNYAFKKINSNYGFGTAGDCEINANCNTEENFQPEKRAVVRIRTVKTVNGKTYLGWCTGTIIGNTNQDDTPYMITADHCYNYMVNGKYEGASTQDLNNWIFYFNYDAPDCDNPISEGTLAEQNLQGAIYKANAGTAGDADSDFCLLELKNKIPTEYNPFWAGWDNRDVGSTSGYSYHHPSGDIKKVNIYTKALVSSEYDDKVKTDTHWEVYWETGVTEAGSSGSSILNEKGQIVGILTGGGSGCSSSTSSDFYGKISYGWEYKSENNSQLKHWLDPTNTDATSIMGYDSKGSKKLEFIDNVNIYPNPITDGTIYFGNIDLTLMKEINIYNINGQVVYTIKNPTSTSYKTNLPTGVYFSRTNYNGEITTTKLLFVN